MLQREQFLKWISFFKFSSLRTHQQAGKQSPFTNAFRSQIYVITIRLKTHADVTQTLYQINPLYILAASYTYVYINISFGNKVNWWIDDDFLKWVSKSLNLKRNSDFRLSVQKWRTALSKTKCKFWRTKHSSTSFLWNNNFYWGQSCKFSSKFGSSSLTVLSSWMTNLRKIRPLC